MRMFIMKTDVVVSGACFVRRKIVIDNTILEQVSNFGCVDYIAYYNVNYDVAKKTLNCYGYYVQPY